MSEVLISTTGAAGHIRLNRPGALNSLTLEMVRAIDLGIDRHIDDPGVGVLVLTGAGTRGLCAGGDIRMLWEKARSAPSEAMRFWAAEYRLNARIATLEKPWVAVMDGICMGGGVGLSVHGSHRVVTERTQFAMPETGIGYFPDVGATYALPRARGRLGLWIGLTGASIGAADVLAAGLADAMVPAADLPALIAALQSGTPPGPAIAALAADPGPSDLHDHAALIDRVFAAGDIGAIMAALQDEDSGFARQTLELLNQRSPGSLVLTLHLLHAGAASPSLQACLDREYAADALILSEHDFHEGIRAAVIDRDRMPRWRPDRIGDVDAPALVARLGPLPTLFEGTGPGAGDLPANAANPERISHEL